MGLRLGKEPLRRLRVRNIRLDSNDVHAAAFPQPPGEGFRLRLVGAIVDDHVGALGGEHLTDARADAGGAPGNEDVFSR